jgi:hypothetical protein
MKKKTKVILGACVAIIVLIQFIPVDRENPVTDGKLEIRVPENIKTILETSCFDCHSYRTKWPFYSYIAPVSWLVADDVSEARHKFNFSTWEALGAHVQNKIKEHIWDDVSENDMPLPIYLLMHSNAKLSAEQKQILKAWCLEENTAADSISVK